MTEPALPPPTTPKAASRTLPLLQIAGLGCVVVLLSMCLVSYLWVREPSTILANMANTALSQMIDDSQLESQQKQRIKKRIDQLVQDYKAGKVSNDQLGRVVDELGQSPLFDLTVVAAVDAQYLAPSALPAPQWAAARRTLQRLARGVYEGHISSQKLNELLAPLRTGRPDERRMKRLDELTREDLETFLSAAQQAADEAQVPDEPFDINIADEVDRIIDTAYGPSAPPAPAKPTS